MVCAVLCSRCPMFVLQLLLSGASLASLQSALRTAGFTWVRFTRVHVCLHACVCESCSCLVPKEARRGHQIPGTSVADSREPPCGFWGSNLGPLQAQPVLLTPDWLLQPFLSLLAYSCFFTWGYDFLSWCVECAHVKEMYGGHRATCMSQFLLS